MVHSPPDLGIITTQITQVARLGRATGVNMTMDEAITIAREVAAREGWPWREPVIATKSRLFLVAGPASWHVMSNVGTRGCNVNVYIDDKTGRITKQAFAPR